jgi:Ca2+-binding RTX toxin-like protein
MPELTSISIAADAASQPEGNSGTTSFTFTVTRSGDTTGTSSVSYGTTGSSFVGNSSNPANADDFEGHSYTYGVVTFASGETTKTITVNVAGDTAVEVDEGFAVVLSNPTGDAVLGNNYVAWSAITNDDSGSLASISIAADAASKPEGNSGTTPFTFTVTRSGDTTGTSSVSYTTSTASLESYPVDATDFAGNVLPNGSVIFAPGEITKKITISIAGDTTLEAKEGFSIVLSSPTGANLGTAAAVATVENDDQATSGADSLTGGAYDDRFDGLDGNDTILGFAGNDILVGGRGDDTLVGGFGNDLLVGGEGIDTAVWTGPRRAYALTLNMHGESKIAGPEGVDTITGIEHFRFADGEYVTDTADVAAQVYRLYGATLGRTPDPDGLENWTKTVQAGALTLSQASSGFVQSAEWQQHYGQQDDRGFVELLYRNVLGREPDTDGLKNWINAFAHGLSRQDAVLGFSESAENVQRTAPVIEAGIWMRDNDAAVVARLYDSALDRLPDADGLINWTNAIKAGMTLHEAVNGFISSAEFQAKYGTLDNKEFVEQLYHNVLDRDGDPGGLENWTGALNAGLTREDVVLGFSESAEHQMQRAPYINDGIWYL